MKVLIDVSFFPLHLIDVFLVTSVELQIDSSLHLETM